MATTKNSFKNIEENLRKGAASCSEIDVNSIKIFIHTIKQYCLRFSENASNPTYDFLKDHEDRLRYEFHQKILSHLGKITSRLSLVGKGSVKTINSELTVI